MHLWDRTATAKTRPECSYKCHSNKIAFTEGMVVY